MDWGLIIPILLSVSTAVVVAFRRVLADFATVIRLQTELKEKISLAQVGIEALGIFDQDVKSKLNQLEQRTSDLERYLQISTPEFDRPFILRESNHR